MPDANPHSGEDLSDWLQEAARRPWTAGPVSINSTVLAGPGPEICEVPPRRRYFQNARELVSLTALTIGYLQYYYLDVMVQIGSLQKIVFFVPLAAA